MDTCDVCGSSNIVESRNAYDSIEDQNSKVILVYRRKCLDCHCEWDRLERDSFIFESEDDWVGVNE